MKILSHRGYWLSEEQRNSTIAFERSFQLQFGTETDIRDLNGKLVISHDMATGDAITTEDLFQIYNSTDPTLVLALNIKADGLQASLKDLLIKNMIENYFVFDMSVPDTLGYIKNNIRFFSRQSEYEPQPVFYNECAGIWLDAFHETWYKSELILDHLNNKKQVAIVSPDLHKRTHLGFWEQLKKDLIHLQPEVFLCTDHPVEAIKYFNE